MLARCNEPESHAASLFSPVAIRPTCLSRGLFGGPTSRIDHQVGVPSLTDSAPLLPRLQPPWVYDVSGKYQTPEPSVHHDRAVIENKIDPGRISLSIYPPHARFPHATRVVAAPVPRQARLAIFGLTTPSLGVRAHAPQVNSLGVVLDHRSQFVELGSVLHEAGQHVVLV
jgi:hypothetical protein